jgi:pimeloyl-ACP methyl ester carboxylesterase
MILNEKVVEQPINRGYRGRFLKQLVLIDGPVPLAMVRKRAVSRGGALRGERGVILLIHGFGQNRYAWHLPLRSVSNFLAQAGHDVFNLDLRGHGRSAHLGARRPVGPAEYVREDVPTALEEIRQLVGDRPVFLVGHSLGGLVSYAVAPSYGSAIAGVAAIGSPYHFLAGLQGLARIGALVHFLEKRVDALHDDLAMPLRLFGDAVRTFRALVDSPLYPLPFRGYAPANIEPDVLSQHMALAMDAGSIRVMRHMFRWAREREGRRDVPGGIEGFGESFEAMTDTPLLVIAGSLDDLAAPAGVLTAYERSHARDKAYRCFPSGHIDLLVGHTAPLTTWPALETWLDRLAPG